MLTQELKKIFRLRPVLAALALGTVYTLMFLCPYYGGSRDSDWAMEAAWLADYGTSFSPKDIDAIEAGLPALYAEADGYLADNPVAQRYGLSSFAGYQFWPSQADPMPALEDELALRAYLSGPETDNILGRISRVEGVLSEYAMQDEQVRAYGYCRAFYDDMSPREIAHVRSVFHGPDEAWRAFSDLLPGSVGTDYTILALLGLCVLLGPAMTGDRMSRVIPLQHASRRGRRLLYTQLAAYLLTAIVCTGLSGLLFAGMTLLAGGQYIFLPCRMYSFYRATYCWPNWTLGAWYLVLWAMGTLICLAAAGTLFLLSRCSCHYISMLLKLIPAFVILCLITDKTLSGAFYFYNDLYRLTGLPYIELAVPAALLVLALGLCLEYILRVRRRDELTA